MAKLYGQYTTPRSLTIPTPMDGSVQGGNVRLYRERITLASQTTSDTIVVAYTTKGESFLFGTLLSTVSLGTSTVSIGVAGATARYRAAATFTAVETPTLFGAGTAPLAALDKTTADEEVFMSIATASLPASGTLVVDLYFAQT